MNVIDEVKFDEKGLVTAIAQDVHSDRVLMLAYMNRETLQETLDTGKMTYWSRSRQERWRKGDTSGHYQSVREVYIDCDGDALLFKVEQKGGACHEGYLSCFYRKLVEGSWETILKKIED
ncbi:phosphoribosyl-AMP cyclohydrolase [Fibrobacterota bacterium]